MLTLVPLIEQSSDENLRQRFIKAPASSLIQTGHCPPHIEVTYNNDVIFILRNKLSQYIYQIYLQKHRIESNIPIEVI